MTTFSTEDILQGLRQSDPNIAKESRLATIDPAYAGLPAFPKVKWDGELTLSQNTYLFIGDQPGPNDRVLMQPLGDKSGWVIAGVVGGSTGIPKQSKMFVKALTPQIDNVPYTATPKMVIQIDLPDPGWPYRIMAGGQAYYQCDTDQAGDDFEFESRWDAVCVLDNISTGVAISRQGIGRSGAYTQAPCLFSLPATVYTGAHTAYLILIRRDGQQGLLWISAGGTSLTVFQVPA